MVTLEQLDFDHLYIPRNTQGQPWPLALGSRFFPSPTRPWPGRATWFSQPYQPWPGRARDFMALQGQVWP